MLYSAAVDEYIDGSALRPWKLKPMKFVTDHRLLRSQVSISQAGWLGRERMALRVSRMSGDVGSRATRRISLAPAEALVPGGLAYFLD